jgi:hypothetical protein
MLVGEGRVEEVGLMPLPLFEATPEQLESLKSDAGGFVS